MKAISKVLIGITLIIALQLPAMSILADDAKAREAKPYTDISILSREGLIFMDVPVVVTASRLKQSLEEAPAAIVIVTRQEIRERGYNNLLDLLEDLPGIDVQSRTAEEISGRSTHSNASG